MLPTPFRNLIAVFSALPGIGPKMAERLVLYLFKQDARDIKKMITALEGLRALSRCTQCFNIAEGDLCIFCKDTQRDTTQICVVEEPLDLIPIERTGVFHGLYHILGGTLTPNTKTPTITIAPLLDRIQNNNVTEVILATNPTTDGDATALYIKSKLLPLGIRVSRLARGLTTGSDIEYVDDITIRNALQNREDLSQ